MWSNIILNENDLKEVVSYFKTQPAFAWDVEAQGEYRGVSHLADLSWISLATKRCCVVIPFAHPIGDKIIGETKIEAVYGPKAQKAGQKYWKKVPLYEDPPEQITPGIVFEILSPLFADPNIIKIGHDEVYDLASIAKCFGFVPAPPYSDTKINDWLLNENILRHGLKERIEEVYGHKYDYENVGKCVESFPFSTVAYYSYCDSKYTWLWYLKQIREIEEQGLMPIHNMEMQLLNTMVGMRLVGARVDLDRLHSLSDTLGKDAVKAEKAIYAAAGKQFNVNSNKQIQQVLYVEQGLKPWKLTTGGLKKKKLGQEILLTDYSVDNDVLESYQDNPVVHSLKEYNEISKLLSTYVNGYLGDEEKPSIIYDEHIHAGFMQYGTVTGRFSCVSGDTLLVTNRGIFRFDEYIPLTGDKVLTHSENMMPVVRKIYRGEEQMFRVSCYNGNTIKCTATHRLYTSDGWKQVCQLRPGDKVIGYDSLSNLYSRTRKYQDSLSVVLREPGKAYDPSGIEDYGYKFSQRPCYLEESIITGNAKAGTKTKVLKVQIEGEPYVWKEWKVTPQLPGRDFGRTRVSSGKSEWEVHSSSPARYGPSFGAGQLTDVARRSPHRRRSIQQRFGQSGVGYEEWTWENPFKEIEVREITPVGTMGVWDIEVEGDHSYAAHGFLNHNCRAPNLQNIPRPHSERGKLVRGIFIAEESGKLVVADYGQIELVVLAHYVGEGKLYEGFMQGIDPHTMTAAMILDKSPEDVTKVERQDMGKTMNFAIVFGAGIYKIASMAHISPEEAKRKLKKHAEMFPEIHDFRASVLATARKRKPVPYITTLLGRRRRISELNSSVEGIRKGAERQMFNALIQGGAADLLKLAMIRVDSVLPPEIQLVLTVHDEIVLSAPDAMAEEAAAMLKEAMTGEKIQKLVRVPLLADVKIVNRWSDAK